jgi:hypothetical protein
MPPCFNLGVEVALEGITCDGGLMPTPCLVPTSTQCGCGTCYWAWGAQWRCGAVSQRCGSGPRTQPTLEIDFCGSPRAHGCASAAFLSGRERTLPTAHRTLAALSVAQPAPHQRVCRARRDLVPRRRHPHGRGPQGLHDPRAGPQPGAHPRWLHGVRRRGRGDQQEPQGVPPGLVRRAGRGSL